MTARCIVIVGAGQAGARAALCLRAQGWRGRIVLIGDEAHAPYERPALSKQMLLDDAAQPTLVAPLAGYDEQSIELWSACTALRLRTQELALDVQWADGRTDALHYDQLLLAPGGRARCLALAGAAEAGVLTLRNQADASRLRAQLQPGRKLLIIGGGFTGLEVAAAARQRGCEVVLLESGARLLGRGVPASLAAQAHALHTARGVQIRLNETPSSIRREAAQVVLGCHSGADLRADAVVACIGMDPHIALARDAGLATSRGIVVDERLRTSALRVFAIGDAAEFPCPAGAGVRSQIVESWDNAQAQAEHVARNMTGPPTAYEHQPWFWSDQYDHVLQMAGHWEPTGQVVVRALPGGSLEFCLDAGHRLCAVAGFAPAGTLAKTFMWARKLLEHGRVCAPADLADSQKPLKTLL